MRTRSEIAATTKAGVIGPLPAQKITSWREAGPRLYVLLVIVWFLQLFAPHKLIQYFVAAAQPLTWVPELLLWICGILWLRDRAPKRGFPAHTRFMLLFLFGTVVAYFHGQWGLARVVDRQMYQYWLLGLVTLTVCDRYSRVRPILALYFGYFLWYGIWGIVSLKTSPLGAVEDTSQRIIVFWHRDYDNRDAFGPLMVAGLAYSIYYLQANRAVMTRGRSFLGYLSMALCATGFVTSFGRGAFVAFLVVGASMWIRSKRKLAILRAVAIIVAVALLSMPSLVDRYVETMRSITEQGTKSGTGADRADLWGIAWREFISSPLIGKGTDNFGAGAATVLLPGEVTPGGYTAGRLWGRAVHSAPMTIIAEYGLLGVMVAVGLLLDFFRTNRRIRRHASAAADPDGTQTGEFPPGYVGAMALALHAAFLTYCVSGIFYEIIYTPLFWNVVALNRMLYYASGASARFENKRSWALPGARSIGRESVAASPR